MPSFIATSPDGRKFQINAPEGATQEEMTAYAEQQLSSLPAQQTAPTAAPSSMIDNSPDLGFTGGLAASLAKLGTGIQQRAAESGPAMGDLYSKILPYVRPDLAPELSNISSEDVRKSAGNVGAKLNTLTDNSNQGLLSEAGQFTGNVAPYLAIPGGPIAAGVASGAAGGYLTPNQAPTAQEGSNQALTNALFGGAVGGATGGIVKGVMSAPAMANSLVRGASNLILKPDTAAISDFAAAGIDPTIAAVGGRGSKILENTLRSLPVSGDIIQKSAQNNVDKLAAKVNDIAESFGPYRTNQETGDIIQQGAGKFIDRFKDKADQLFADTRGQFKPNEPTAVTKTMEFLNNQGAGLTPALKDALANPKLKGITAALEADLTNPNVVGANGTLPYEAVLAARSKIGRELSDSVMSDIPRAELKQLYGALSDDLKQAAADKGPAALSSFNRANAYYKAGIDRIETSLQGLVKKGADPEKVYQMAVSGSKDGATKLMKIKKSLTADEFSALQAQTVRKLGLAKPGAQDATGDAFSPTTFLTNWTDQNLSKEAKNALFPGPVKDSLDRLAAVASRYKDVQKLANTSNTSNNLGMLGLIVGAVRSPIKTAAGLTGGAVTAKMITSPRFVNWLTDSATKKTPSQMSQHLQKLATIGLNSDPDLRDNIHSFITNMQDLQMSDTGNQPLPPAQ